jgi:hypothetical protein
VTITRSSFLLATLAVGLTLGCGDSEPEPRAPVPPPEPAEAPRTPVAELTGWPAGLGRALVVRLGSPDNAYRLVVPELGSRRFADSLLSVRIGDSISMVLLGRRGRAGDAVARVVDAETGAGACVTWPSAEISGARTAGRSGAWRVAAERDSVIPIAVDSLLGMSSADSASLTNAVLSLLPSLPPATDSAMRGIPFTIMRAYRLRVSGIPVVAAELARTSSTEADPRQQRLFLVGEQHAGASTHQLVYSRDASGPADMMPVTELIVALTPQRSRSAILILGVEGPRGLQLLLVQRTGSRQWRPSWGSVVEFC